MKKLITIVVAFVYLAITCGLVFNVHYCKGKISAVKIDLLAQELCACGSKKKTNACCKTEHKIVKLEDNHKISQTNIAVQAPVALLQHNIAITNSAIKSQQPLLAYNNHAPPLPTHDLCVVNCVFRI